MTRQRICANGLSVKVYRAFTLPCETCARANFELLQNETSEFNPP